MPGMCPLLLRRLAVKTVAVIATLLIGDSSAATGKDVKLEGDWTRPRPRARATEV